MDVCESSLFFFLIYYYLARLLTISFPFCRAAALGAHRGSLGSLCGVTPVCVWPGEGSGHRDRDGEGGEALFDPIAAVLLLLWSC